MPREGTPRLHELMNAYGSVETAVPRDPSAGRVPSKYRRVRVWATTAAALVIVAVVAMVGRQALVAWQGNMASAGQVDAAPSPMEAPSLLDLKVPRVVENESAPPSAPPHPLKTCCYVIGAPGWRHHPPCLDICLIRYTRSSSVVRVTQEESQSLFVWHGAAADGKTRAAAALTALLESDESGALIYVVEDGQEPPELLCAIGLGCGREGHTGSSLPPAREGFHPSVPGQQMVPEVGLAPGQSGQDRPSPSPIVADLGSTQLTMGFAGAAAPSLRNYAPNLCRDASTLNLYSCDRPSEGDTLWGRPVDEHVFIKWGIAGPVLRHAALTQLRVTPDDHAWVLVRPAATRLQRYSPRTHNLPYELRGLGLRQGEVDSDVMAIIGMGWSSGLVIDVGAAHCTVSPVINGAAIASATYVSPMGLDAVRAFEAAQSGNRIGEGGCMTQRSCRVPRRGGFPQLLQDGDTLWHPEVLFEPSLAGWEDAGVGVMARSSLSDVANRYPLVLSEVYSHIVVTGGGANLDGIATRVREEIAALAPYGHRRHTAMVVTGQDAIWTGASVVSSWADSEGLITGGSALAQSPPVTPQDTLLLDRRQMQVLDAAGMCRHPTLGLGVGDGSPGRGGVRWLGGHVSPIILPIGFTTTAVCATARGVVAVFTRDQVVFEYTHSGGEWTGHGTPVAYVAGGAATFVDRSTQLERIVVTVPRDNSILVLDSPLGSVLHKLTLPASVAPISDIATTADGHMLYVLIQTDRADMMAGLSRVDLDGQFGWASPSFHSLHAALPRLALPQHPLTALELMDGALMVTGVRVGSVAKVQGHH